MTVMKYDEAWSWAAKAGADLSAKIHYFAKMNSDGEFVLAGAGEAALGTIYEGTVEDGITTVMFGAVGKVILGGTVVAGARVEVGSGGKAVVWGSGVAQGIALEGGDANKIIPIAFIGR